MDAQQAAFATGMGNSIQGALDSGVFCPVMNFIVDQATRTEPVPTPGKASIVHTGFNDDEPEVGSDALFSALLATSWN